MAKWAVVAVAVRTLVLDLRNTRNCEDGGDDQKRLQLESGIAKIVILAALGI